MRAMGANHKIDQVTATATALEAEGRVCSGVCCSSIVSTRGELHGSEFAACPWFIFEKFRSDTAAHIADDCGRDNDQREWNSKKEDSDKR